MAKYQCFPLRSHDLENDEETFFYPDIFKSYILTLPSKSFKGQITALGIELTKLSTSLCTDALIFLGDTQTPWLFQENDYKPAREALQYLKEEKIGKHFNGALRVETLELPTFTKHFAWLIRCNAALPYFYFTDQRQNVTGSVCKYGNLHLDTLNEQADKLLKAFLGSSKFRPGDANSCYNRFGKTNAISGRQAIV